jgi:hypothetical protein
MGPLLIVAMMMFPAVFVLFRAASGALNKSHQKKHAAPPTMAT